MKKKILAKNSSWSFEKNVPKKFSYHIKKSVPFYQEGHNIICNVSDFFLKKNSYVYDIGSSTGTLLNKIADRHNNKKINFYGVETVKEMIIQSRLENKNNKIKYINKDIKKIVLKRSDLIISYYTIQFIDPKYRQFLLDKIYKTLNWGGAFIMFEKIRASDARFQDIYTQIYNDFKLDQGFTEKEIINKSRSLKGILEPFSDYGNIGMLKRSGFIDIIPIFQWLCFKGYLAIK
jgi:tRNA (cmo5U34)-methyltransferase